MTDKEDVMSAMYAQEDELPDEKRPQPEQLRLAGKATVVTLSGKQVAIPRIDYVESLERLVKDQDKMIIDQAARLKKLEIAMNRITNIAERRISSVESEVKGILNNRKWD